MENGNRYSEQVKSMVVLHTALLLGQLLFGAVVALNHYKGVTPTGTTDESFANALLYVAMALLPVEVIVSVFIFRSRMKAAKLITGLGARLQFYRTALITRCALLLGGVFLCIVFFMVSGKWQLFALAAPVTLYFISIRPTAERVASDLELSSAEKEELMREE